MGLGIELVRACQHLAASFAGVTTHGLRRTLRVTDGKLFKYLMVLVVGTLHLATLHQTKTPEEVKFIEQPAVNARKPSVATDLNQALVEAEVESVIPAEIFRFGCGIHRFHHLLEFFDLCAGEAAGCTSGGKFLQGRVDIVDFNGLVQIDLSHKGPAVRFDLEETRRGEGAKRFSNRASADPEAGGHFLFGELLAGGEFACEDPLCQRELHVEGAETMVGRRTERL